MLTSHIVIIMLQDIFKIMPHFVLRRFRPIQQPLSSVTLRHQAAALLVSTACFIVAVSFYADFVFTRSGTVVVRQGATELPVSTIQPTLDRLGIALRYRDVPSS
jgi:uncharacterized membrane protein YesL